MSKTKTILAARKGTISDEPLKFEYSSLIDVFELFNLVGGGTESDTADLLLNSSDFLRLNCYFIKSESEIGQQFAIVEKSRELIVEFLKFMFENAKDINNYFNGIHNHAKSPERIKQQLDDYAITYSKYFMKIEDVLSLPTAKMVGIDETLFIVQMNTTLWANKKIMVLKAENEALISISNEIIENMHKEILSLKEEINSKNNGQTLSKGDLVVIAMQNDRQAVGVVINKKHLLNNDWFSIYLLVDENNEPLSINSLLMDKNSIFYTPNQTFMLDINTLLPEYKEKIQNNFLYKNSSNIVGYVSKDSNINKIKFHLILDEQNKEEQSIGEGSILTSSIFGQETLYQIIDGITTEENLEHKDKYGFTTVIAKKIGNYDKTKKELNTVKWLPSIYSPIFIQKDIDEVVHDSSKFIGTLPNTSYEIEIKEPNSLVTHNTAILGILGIGKSRLTFELIQKIINTTGTKVICIDITNQYFTELKSYLNPDQIFAESKATLSRIRKYSERAGSKTNPNDWGNEKLYQKIIKRRIQAFNKSKGKVLVFNPDWHKVKKTRSSFNIEYTDDLTIAEKTRVISEQVFMYAMSQGETDKARFLLVFEEAHSLIPEWNSTANPGDQSASNGTAKVILQGRKYGLGSFVVTQRTANISKSILNQCNTIFALRVFDDTGKQFLENYIGSDYANVLPTLEERHCIAVGKAMKLKQPIILKLNDMENILVDQ